MRVPGWETPKRPDRHTNKHRDSQTDRQKDRKAVRQTDSKTDRQEDRKTGRQKDRQQKGKRQKGEGCRVLLVLPACSVGHYISPTSRVLVLVVACRASLGIL